MKIKENGYKMFLFKFPEAYERYLDEIYKISKTKEGGYVKNKEISEKMKLTPSSVTCMLYKLRALGLILWNPRKPIRLTKRGGEIVRNLNEIKSLLKLLFEDVLGIKEEEMISKLSCEIEHHFTRGLKESLQKFLIESGYL